MGICAIDYAERIHSDQAGHLTEWEGQIEEKAAELEKELEANKPVWAEGRWFSHEDVLEEIRDSGEFDALGDAYERATTDDEKYSIEDAFEEQVSDIRAKLAMRLAQYQLENPDEIAPRRAA